MLLIIKYPPLMSGIAFVPDLDYFDIGLSSFNEKYSAF